MATKISWDKQSDVSRYIVITPQGQRVVTENSIMIENSPQDTVIKINAVSVDGCEGEANVIVIKGYPKFIFTRNFSAISASLKAEKKGKYHIKGYSDKDYRNLIFERDFDDELILGLGHTIKYLSFYYEVYEVSDGSKVSFTNKSVTNDDNYTDNITYEIIEEPPLKKVQCYAAMLLRPEQGIVYRVQDVTRRAIVSPNSSGYVTIGDTRSCAINFGDDIIIYKTRGESVIGMLRKKL